RNSYAQDCAVTLFPPGRFEVPLPEEVHAPPVAGGHRGDELAAAGRRVEHAARFAEPSVDVPGDFVPDLLPAGLVDVSEPVSVEPLIVDAARGGCRGCRGLEAGGCHKGALK